MNSIQACSGCGLQLGKSMKLCPSCGRLVHTDELNRLAAAAVDAEHAGQNSEALGHWRQAIELLPINSLQAQQIAQRINDLVKLVDSSPQRPSSSDASKQANGPRVNLGLIGAIGLMAWKFKWLAALLLTKGKLVLFGLTKVSTLASMGVWVAAYAMALGWRFALGMAVVIYIHEMGHVYALQRLGIRAGAPLFIPGVGALVRLKQTFVQPLEDARIGLAGPLWGLAAAIGTALIYAATGHVLFGALTQVGAWINLFNLIPIGPLDGGRGFRALSRRQRVLLLVVMFATLLGTGDGILIIILIVAGFRTLTERSAEPVESWLTLGQFALLIVALSALARFHNLAEEGALGAIA